MLYIADHRRHGYVFCRAIGQPLKIRSQGRIGLFIIVLSGARGSGFPGTTIMRAVIQRVSEASVTIGGSLKSAIKNGLLLLLAMEEADPWRQSTTCRRSMVITTHNANICTA